VLCARWAHAPAAEARFVRQHAGRIDQAVRKGTKGKAARRSASDGSGSLGERQDDDGISVLGGIRVVAGVFRKQEPARRAAIVATSVRAGQEDRGRSSGRTQALSRPGGSWMIHGLGRQGGVPRVAARHRAAHAV
jgi:hypothetical protein